MRVYRVESKCRLHGPYRFYDAMLERRSHTAPRCPIPSEDGMPKIDYALGGYRFGFVSLSDLLQWFDRQDLYILGFSDYVINVYDVPDCDIARGGKQVAFYRGRLLPIETLPLPARAFNIKMDSACPLLPPT